MNQSQPCQDQKIFMEKLQIKLVFATGVHENNRIKCKLQARTWLLKKKRVSQLYVCFYLNIYVTIKVLMNIPGNYVYSGTTKKRKEKRTSGNDPLI